MKLLGVRADPLSGVRRRAALQAAAESSGQSATTTRSGDTAAFLGLTPADMTAPVKAALATLLTEIDELRREVGALLLQRLDPQHFFYTRKKNLNNYHHERR